MFSKTSNSRSEYTILFRPVAQDRPDKGSCWPPLSERPVNVDMSKSDTIPSPPARGEDASPKPRKLPPAALRALAEAEARRREIAPERPSEIGGRGGPEPVRYGDWEVKGLAVDF